MTLDFIGEIYSVIRGEIKRFVPSWAWMTVVSADPLRIKYDYEDDPLDLTPDTLVPWLRVGDRVHVRIRSGELPLIIGKSVVEVRPAPFAVATGIVLVQGVGTPSTTAAVTFPVDRFTQPPVVTMSPTGNSSTDFRVQVGTTTTSGTALRLTHSGNFSGAYNVHWVAIQMEA